MSKKSVLAGVRVLDLTRVWAGPLAVRMLADLGAEVILIEALQARGGDKALLEVMKQMRKEGRRFRFLPDGDPGDQPWNRQGLFNDFHRNKYGITLDLSKSEGQDIFKQLVKISDVVVENYTPRVMKNFGLDYPILKEINPGIIMISMPGYGMTGPYRDYPAFGTVIEQYVGFGSTMGYADSGPYRMQSTYPDPVAAVNGASAVMLALWHRRRTGKGQYIDQAMIEASTGLLGEVILDYSMNKRLPQRLGNRHRFMAPHGCYRCRGEDVWVVIAVANDEEWQSLSDVMGNPAWTKEERFADQLSRWNNQDELDKLISEWTIRHDHYQVMHMLQGAGVTVGAVLNAKETLSDPQLKDRNYFIEVTHPQAGTHLYPGLPLKLSRTPASFRRPAPCIGEHNEYILGKLLNLSKDEIAQLEKDQVISTGPIINE